MNSSQPAIPLSVWYDGDCPVCRQEVALYSRIDQNRALEWIDIVTLADSDFPAGKTRDDLLGRFHARQANGPWHTGVDAFAAIWDQLPVLARLAFFFRTPGIRQLAELGYRGFLKWQRHHRARRILSKQPVA
ncbi:thiol-disulfide oxidoreductase DCC family protein [Hoeflea sp.]|uniref:thiol-disulfide oxidoreductase DCC family protein n=1 Tax=Hoeflea sp. TaxID=1940281 RepID=UPI003A8F6102